jgi:hypothetical protein
MSARSARRRRPVLGGAAALAAGLFGGESLAPALALAFRQSTPIQLERERGASLAEERRWDEAEKVLRAVTTRKEAMAQDFANVACVVMGRQVDPVLKPAAPPHLGEDVEQICAEASRRDPSNAAAAYLAGVIWANCADPRDPARARPFLEKAIRLAPDDAFPRYQLGALLQDFDERELAIAEFQKVHAMGLEFAAAVYQPATYKLGMLLRRRNGPGDRETGALLVEESNRLEKPATTAEFVYQTCTGRLGHVRVVDLDPKIAAPARAAQPVQWGSPYGFLEMAGELRSIDVGDFDGNRRTDVVAAGTNGLWIASQREPGIFTQARLAAGDYDRVLAAELDLRNENRQVDPTYRARSSVLAFGKSGVRLFFAQQPGWFTDDSASLPELRDVKDVQLVDFDHDGMLDLLFTTGDGVKLLRNHGTPMVGAVSLPAGPIAFDDATARASLAGVRADWVAIEDFDHDHDVDLLFGGKDVPTLLFSSLRRGQFELFDAKKTGLPSPLPLEPLLADFDRDGVPDVLTIGADASLFHGQGDGTFAAARRVAPVPATATMDGLADVDLDGAPDLVATNADGGIDFVRAIGTAGTGELAPIPALSAMRTPIVEDVDSDGALDVLTMAQAGACLIRGDRDVAPTRTLLVLRGRKDNRFAIGAVVEIRAGTTYERRFVRRPDQHFTFPPGDVPPIVRLTWPNGVVQYPLQSKDDEDVLLLPPLHDENPVLTLPVDPRTELRLLIEQKKGPPGSCPFLYAWDGAKYRFITDVLGATPLGLPIDEKVFVPPAHDEFVRLAPDQVKAVDGEYRFQLTEELREVTYLDRAQLWVVDHAADVELHPEERFCFPPFPPKRIHAMKHVVGLAKAVDQDGVDWTEALARVDDTPAIPFRPVGEVFRGIATPSVLELTLPEAAKTAKRVRLLMTGWLQWGDASVNLASAKNGSIEFVPPIFSVPDDHGGWRDCGPPVGFPTGKTKTMVLDVGDLLNRADPRLRITTTLELYWDAIRVALDDDATPANGDAPYTVTKLEPKSAALSFRGFSEPTARRPDQPQLFDWDHLEPFARWDQHAGMLTRFGDVQPLLGDVDDRFVILSAGDAIDLRFDASTIPPPAPGMTRTWLLYLDGWAKDGDPNTVTSQTVEPLPFHAMSGYPYGADEHYPDDEVHALYQREWNTRPGRILVPSLAPTASAPR